MFLLDGYVLSPELILLLRCYCISVVTPQLIDNFLFYAAAVVIRVNLYSQYITRYVRVEGVHRD